MSAGRCMRLSVALAAAVLAVAPATAGATDGETVVARGLDNPRGLTVAPGGTIYVAEAGRGGPTCLPIPVADSSSSCRGLTGAITRIRHGQQTRIVTGLPSAAPAPDGSAAVGPNDVSFDPHGRLWFSLGLGSDPTLRAEVAHGRRYGTLARVGLGGRVATVADIAGFEASANPLGPPDSNPYGVLAGSRVRYVTDAGGNDVVAVDARTGEVRLVAAFPDVTVGSISMEAVPTGIVRGPDGALYVGELTGFPFPVGGATVWRVVPGQAPEPYATGFTNITDLAFGVNGDLYVLQGTTAGLAAPPSPGQLIRVSRTDGARTVVAGDLVLPTGLALHGGFAYVSVHGAEAGAGEVLRIPVSAVASGASG